MPEREAMNYLGHESRAIHAAHAGGATVATLPLEFYEAQKLKNLVQFTNAALQRDRATTQRFEAKPPYKGHRRGRLACPAFATLI